MLQIKQYLPIKAQEALSEIQDYLLGIHVEKYLTLANALKAVGALSASYVAYKVARILAVRRKYAHIPGPKTKGLVQFFVGNLPPAHVMDKEEKMLVDYLLDWHNEYGPVFKFQILDQIIVSTTDPVAIKKVYIEKNYPKSSFFFYTMMWPFGFRFVPYSLATHPDKKAWREDRNLFNPGFHRNALMSYVGEFNSKGDILMEKLRSLADGKTPFKLFKELNYTSLDAIASIAFGMNLDSINNEKDREFNDCLAGILEIIGDLFRNPWLKYSPFSIPQALRLRRMLKQLRGMGRQKILERLSDSPTSADQNDILANLLKGMTKNSLDLEKMVDHFVLFFGAGQETTASTLASSFLELGKNKKVFDKCREEIDNVLGPRTEVTFEDIPKLKYVGSVFKEALRLYPPAPFLHRFVDEELTTLGYKVPVNTNMSFPNYVIGRMESNFPNPLEFKPERFIKDSDSMDTAVSSYTYFPFALGTRNCIGQNFAQIESIIILTKFIQKFDFYLAPNQSLKPMLDQTLKPKDGVVVVLSLRK